MINPLRFFRLIKIYLVLVRQTFNPHVIGDRSPVLRFISYFNLLNLTRKGKTPEESLRLAFEELGPIFVKFGQLLSTRRDLLSDEMADELAKLQDRVPPFPSEKSIALIEKACGANVNLLFAEFDSAPMASASVAQVHAATMHDGSKVIVKVLRPNIAKIIAHDVAIMYFAAKLIERFWHHGKRVHPVALVNEFEQTITDELDLQREAANASLLRRNFADSNIMYVPKVYWQYVHRNVLVMERIYGIQISDVTALKAHGTNMKKLAEYGVEIFFTQVFRDSFFHADMHPGNLFVDVTDPENPKYNGVDFGIMGALGPRDQHYLAANLMAFFNRDYRQVAVLHVESGWVPPDTRIEQFESAIRTVCEPIFEKPLHEISFGQLLLRLFQTAERFHMEVQPQLMLLQKTLLSIEGLGRQLYPDLDLWSTAKPFLEKWMKSQYSLLKQGKEAWKEFPEVSEQLLKSPKLVYRILEEIGHHQLVQKYSRQESSRFTNNKRGFLLGVGLSLSVVAAFVFTQHYEPNVVWQWALAATAGVCLLMSWALSD